MTLDAIGRRTGEGQELLMPLVKSMIRRFANSLFRMEESMAGHVGIKGVF
jgi:hypothetical protein